MASSGLIPRQRLRHIPNAYRLAHEYCFFLHDECARLLVEYEKAKAHHVSIKLRSTAEKRKFDNLTNADPIEALRATGHTEEARRVILNTITMAMVSDCLHHVYEALRCSEKRKFVVAFNLLRKPLMDNLLYLSWMLADPDDFYKSFSAGNPEQLTPKFIGNRRKEIITRALGKTRAGELLDPDELESTIFDPKNAYGLFGLFQHAVHLVTTIHTEVRTTPENFNFIFKSPHEDDTYEGLYEPLPLVLFFLSHVMLELFDQIKPMDQEAKEAFISRSIVGLELAIDNNGTARVVKAMQENLSPHIQCPNCFSQLKITMHNASRIVLSDSFRCHQCRSIQSFPFSYLF